MVEMKYGSVQVQQTEIIDEIKSLALRGHEVFSIVLEKVSALPTDNDSLMVLKQQLQKEHNVFKSKVEEVQLKLTSPTLEHKKLDEFTAEGAIPFPTSFYFPICDNDYFQTFVH